MRSIAILLLLTSLSAFGQIRALTSTTDLAWLVRKIGGPHVQVESLLGGTEDPHYVDAMPHWIVKASRADVFCFVGLDLEVGWLPRVLSRAGNPKILPGGAGHCEAGKTVQALDVPTGRIDRSMGDIHPGGNPHYNLGPSFFLQAGSAVLAALSAVDAERAAVYAKNMAALKKELSALRQEIRKTLAPLRDKKLMSYHREFTYFFHDFNLISIGEIEETPGSPPSAGQIAAAAINAKQNKVFKVLASKAHSARLLERFSKLAGVPVARVPVYMQKGEDYPNLLRRIAAALLK